jgi:hypothetical protein
VKAARTTPFDNPIASVTDAGGQPPPWLWRIAAMVAGIAAAALINRVMSVGQKRFRTKKSPDQVGWIAAAVGAAVAGIAASVGRRAAQHAVTSAWTRRVSPPPA